MDQQQNEDIYLAEQQVQKLRIKNPGTIFTLGEHTFILEGFRDDIQTYFMVDEEFVNVTAGKHEARHPLYSAITEYIIDDIRLGTSTPVTTHLGLALALNRTLNYTYWLTEQRASKSTLKDWGGLAQKLATEYGKSHTRIRTMSKKSPGLMQNYNRLAIKLNEYLSPLEK